MSTAAIFLSDAVVAVPIHAACQGPGLWLKFVGGHIFWVGRKIDFHAGGNPAPDPSEEMPMLEHLALQLCGAHSWPTLGI